MSSDTDTPPRPLPPLSPIPIAKRKRGRPKGSKNKRSSRRRLQQDIATVNEAFGAAFVSVPPLQAPSSPPIPPVGQVHDDENNEDENEGVENLQALEVQFNDNENEMDRANEEEEENEMGFGAANMYDVNEILELGSEIVQDEDHVENDDSDRIINSLKHGCVAKSSLRSYNLSLVTFLIYVYKFDRHLMHNSWIKAIDSFTYGIQNEKKLQMAMKKTITALLKKADEKCPPIDLEDYSAKHFIKYLLSLRTPTGQRLSSASYSNKRSSLFHMFRMYAVKQSAQFELELTAMFKGLKRQLAREKQHGNGKIQTGKSPMPYALYRRINEFYLLENSTDAIFARLFLCITVGI